MTGFQSAFKWFSGTIAISACLLVMTGVQSHGQGPIFRELGEMTGLKVRKSMSVSVVDFNNDGADDVMITRAGLNNLLFRNNQDGSFTDVSLDAGLWYFGRSLQTVWADINSDGYQDLFLATSAGEENKLFLNNGDETFTDISESAGINTTGVAISVHWADINGDSMLDLFVFNLNEGNHYFINNGDNRFTDYSEESGIVNRILNMGSVFLDFDKDGDMDVFTSHDSDVGNFMYENDGQGNFTDVTEELGMYTASNAMAASVGDFNNDGWPDIYLTNLRENYLFKNNQGESFTEVAGTAGVDDPGMGWGVSWLDYDNDGFLDIYVANDTHYSPYSNVLYRNNGDETFTQVDSGLPVSSELGSYSSSISDLDRDGDLDILVSNRGPKDHSEFFLNEIENDNKWLILKLEGTDFSSTVGAEVQVTTDQGSYYRYVHAGTGWQSDDSENIHFGLGKSTSVQEVKVTWPDRSTTIYTGINLDEAVLLKQDGSKNTLVYDLIPLDGNIVTSLDDELAEEIRLWPNPAQGFIRVDLSNRQFTKLSFELVDLKGVIVQKAFPDKNHSGIYEISNGNLEDGLYLLWIKMDEKFVVKKVLVRN